MKLKGNYNNRFCIYLRDISLQNCRLLSWEYQIKYVYFQKIVYKIDFRKYVEYFYSYYRIQSNYLEQSFFMKIN